MGIRRPPRQGWRCRAITENLTGSQLHPAPDREPGGLGGSAPLAARPSGCDNGPVRTTPLIGSKAWFGPRRLGWGLAPVSPEGWAVTAAATTASLVVRKRGGGLRARLVLTAVLLLVVVLKGTAPGGPVARRAFEEARRAGGAVTA
jgi:hypothetical protein